MTWSIVSGPLTSISPGGLATAGIVYQDSEARARGVYIGNTSPPLMLTVLNTNIDNLPGYDNPGSTTSGRRTTSASRRIQSPARCSIPMATGKTTSSSSAPGTCRTTQIHASARAALRSAAAISNSNFRGCSPAPATSFNARPDFVTWTDILTLNPVTASAPFTQPLPTVGTKSFYRVGITKP